MRDARSFFAWTGLFLLNALGILPWLRIKFPIGDLAEMVYEAQRLHLGFVPYKDTFTHHFLGYVIPFYVIGFVTPVTPVVVKFVALCFNFATAVIVWHVVREVGRPSLAWLGAFLTVTLGWFWSWQGYGFNVQSAIAPAVAGQLLFVVRACIQSRPSSLNAAAFLSGVLLICDQRALVFAALPAVACIGVPGLRRWRVAAPALAWFMVAPAGAALYLWHAGAWQDFIQQTIVFPLEHRNHGVSSGLAPMVRVWFGTWLGGERIAVPWMLAGLAAALAFERSRPLQAVWLASAMCAAVYAGLGGRPFPNYFMVFAPVTLVLVSLFPQYIAAGWPRAGRVAMGAALALGLFCGIRPIILWSGTGSVFLPANEGTVDSVVSYLRATTRPADGVLVWGFSPQIYVLSERLRTFRDAGLLSVAGANFASSDAAAQRPVPGMVREFESYLANTPPRVIIVYRITEEPCPAGVIQRNFDYERNSALKAFRNALAASYRLDRVVTGACDRADVFVLTGRSQD